jgi:hypothetical protein
VVELVLERGARADLVERASHLASGQPADDAEEHRVLPPGQLAREARVDRQQRGDVAAHVDAPFVRSKDPGDAAKERRLARAARADERDPFAGADGEGDVAEAPRLLAAPAQARELRRDDAALAVELEPDAEPVHCDRRGHTTFAKWRASRRYTGSSTASRSNATAVG